MSEKTPHSINPEFGFYARHTIADNVLREFKEISGEDVEIRQEEVGFRFFNHDGTDFGDPVIRIGGKVKAGGKSEELISEAYRFERSDDNSSYVIISIETDEMVDYMKESSYNYKQHAQVKIIQDEVQSLFMQHDLYPDNDEFRNASIKVARLGKLSESRGMQRMVYDLVGQERLKWGIEQLIQQGRITDSQRSYLSDILESFS